MREIFDSDSSSKREISGTKFELIFSWFSIWFNSLLNFKLLNFMWWHHDDAGNDADDDVVDAFENLINLYEELSKLYAGLFNANAELSWVLRDLEELFLLNFLIILLIVKENNHNFILNQFR